MYRQLFIYFVIYLLHNILLFKIILSDSYGLPSLSSPGYAYAFECTSDISKAVKPFGNLMTLSLEDKADNNGMRNQ